MKLSPMEVPTGAEVLYNEWGALGKALCGRVRSREGDLLEQEWSWGKHFGDLYSVNM
jgi:hypothetical protein